MTIRDELEDFVGKTLREQWTTRDGRVVPDTDDVALSNVAVTLDATVLYADLARSTQLVRDHRWHFPAEIYKSFLYTASRLIRHHDGSITAFDGDRVMGVFLGGSKNTNAAKTALRINWAATKLIQPAMKAQYPNKGYVLKHRVGVDTSEIHVIRAGVRGSNDLVWVSNAANQAAKMASLAPSCASYITAAVYNQLNEKAKFSRKNGQDNQDMWQDLGTRDLGYRIYGSTWWWSP